MLRNLFFLITLALVSSCDGGPDLVGPDDPLDFDLDFDFPARGGVNGSGNVVTESRALGPFHAVSFSGVGNPGATADLVLEQTGSPSLTITAEDNIQPFLVSEVVDGWLTLGVAPNTNLGPVQQIEFRLTVPALDALSVLGAARVDATGIDTDRLDVVVNGATTVTIAGRADHQDITIRGASTYDASWLDSRTVTVDATGASRVVVRVSEAVDRASPRCQHRRLHRDSERSCLRIRLTTINSFKRS